MTRYEKPQDEDREDDAQLRDAARKEAEGAELKVWAVVYSNYSPSEIDSLWRTESGARGRADELGFPWDVEEWSVR